MPRSQLRCQEKRLQTERSNQEKIVPENVIRGHEKEQFLVMTLEHLELLRVILKCLLWLGSGISGRSPALYSTPRLLAGFLGQPTTAPPENAWSYSEQRQSGQGRAQGRRKPERRAESTADVQRWAQGQPGTVCPLPPVSQTKQTHKIT